MFREGEFSVGYYHTDNDFGSKDISSRLRLDLRDAVMSRSNERALGLLQKIGHIGVIEGVGDNCICLTECADYYGVTDIYLKGVIDRQELRKNYPEDAKDVHLDPANNNDFVSCLGGTVHARGRRIMLTPRFVLMVSMYIASTDKSRGANNIKRVLTALKRSTYRFPLVSETPEPIIAEDAAPEVPAPAVVVAVPQKDEPVPQPSPVSAVVTEKTEQSEKPVPTDTVMISPEFFGKMVMSAAMELVKGRERA